MSKTGEVTVSSYSDLIGRILFILKEPRHTKSCPYESEQEDGGSEDQKLNLETSRLEWEHDSVEHLKSCAQEGMGSS